MDRKKSTKGKSDSTKTKTEGTAINVKSKDNNSKNELNITHVKNTQSDTNVKSNTQIENTKTKKEVLVTDGLSEKEKRKIEWEKKRAEEKKQTNKKSDENDLQGLSKAEQKAKRRELQEAQRLAKIKANEEKQIEIKQQTTIKETKTNAKTLTKAITKPKFFKKSENTCRVQLLDHLYFKDSKTSQLNNLLCLKNVHPAFIQLGVQYSTNTILGSNARCIALLSALNELVKDIKSPPNQEFCRYLESVLQNCTDYLQKCRPMAVSMTNALRLFKLQLTQMDTNLSDEDKKLKLLDSIRMYIQDQILTAAKAISMKLMEKISDGDNILIYGCSSLIKRILVDASENKKKFKVIIADGRSLLEGREMLRRLTEADIDCTYISINSLSYVMPKVSKVLLGAHALLNNGNVMSRNGTAQVALVAQAYNKPVLVCCERYKFSEKVQMDSLVYNEIGDPDGLLNITRVEGNSPISAWKKKNKLFPLNLFYDVAPAKLVTAVVTEIAILPCTSVPCVLRIKPIEF